MTKTSQTWQDRSEERRRNKGLTYDQMGAKIGVHGSAVQKWMSSKRKTEDLEVIRKVAEALDCDPLDLLLEPELKQWLDLFEQCDEETRKSIMMLLEKTKKE